jgi:hypothetical protein
MYASPRLRTNLDHYLQGLISHPYSGDLLVGEAPGWAGCALTGIPFTSERVIASSPHPFISSLRPYLLRTGTQSESSATIVWQRLESGSRLPAFWNAFPFHPHYAGVHENRPPNWSEQQFGATVLAMVIDILTPRRIFAVGRKAEETFSAHFPAHAAPYIRHPSFGGKSAFLAGMTAHQIA